MEPSEVAADLPEPEQVYWRRLQAVVNLAEVAE
jgi:hypothetical protein